MKEQLKKETANLNSKKFIAVLLCFPLCYFGKLPPNLFTFIIVSYLGIDYADKHGVDVIGKAGELFKGVFKKGVKK